MTKTATAPVAEITRTLATQAQLTAEHYPELYDYLTRRDQALAQALARIPSRADVELASTFNVRSHLEQMMRALPPGVGDLRAREIPQVIVTDEETNHA